MKTMTIAAFIVAVVSSIGLGKDNGYTVNSELLNAIAQHESGNCDKPKGCNDNGEAVGRFQLHKEYVNDVNRILKIRYGKKAKQFTYKDRWNGDKSREMTTIYLSYWGQYNKIDCDDNFNLSRLHNGGCYGHKKKATLNYAKKIQAIMKGGK